MSALPVVLETADLKVQEGQLHDVPELGSCRDEMHRADERQIPLERFRYPDWVLGAYFTEKRAVAVCNEKEKETGT